MSDIQLVPGILKNNKGEYMAPKTFSDLVRMTNGDTLDNVIEDIYAIDRSCTIQTKTYVLEVSVPSDSDTEYQTVFKNIPIPVSGFNLEKGVLMLLNNDKKLIDSSFYTVDIPNLTITITNLADLKDFLTDGNKIYLVYVYTENVITGGKYSVSTIKRSVTITEECRSINIDIDFIKGKDTLMVFTNSVYIEEGTDYNIDSNSKYIYLLNENDKFSIGDTVNFVLLSNSNGKVVSLKNSKIVDTSTLSVVNVSKVAIDIHQYNRSCDSLMVYMNGTYLEVNQDYYISDDSKYIYSIGTSFQVLAEEKASVRFDFVVFKNVLDYNTVNSIFVSDNYENILDDSTGFFNTWSVLESSPNTKLTISPDGANDCSNAIVIENLVDDSVGIIEKNIMGAYNHKQFITLQAKIKLDTNFVGNVNVKIHAQGDREVFSSNFYISANSETDTKNTWLELDSTGQIILADDLINLVPVKLKVVVTVTGIGIINLSEVKVTKAKIPSPWCSSNEDTNYVMKIVSALSV